MAVVFPALGAAGVVCVFGPGLFLAPGVEEIEAVRGGRAEEVAAGLWL